MDNIILKGEDISLDKQQILRITDGLCNILTYKDLEGYLTIDELLGNFQSVIILYQTRENFGHWVALTRNKSDTLTFFDPYGLKIDEELKFSLFNLRSHNNKRVPHLTALIDKSSYKLINNKIQLQELLEHTNTCGRWVALWVRFKTIGLDKFQKLFLNQKFKPDFYASALTLLI